MKYSKFSHKTPHLKGKQHQLDPNLDLKQLVHHASVEFVDRDADGDVDVYDNPKKPTSDENPVGDFGKVSKELIKKQKGELKHTKRGVAYEDLRKWFSKSHPEGNWKRYNTKGEAIGPCAREEGESKPKCLSNEKAAKMSKDEIAASVRRKRKADPVADRPGKGGKPIMSSNKIDEGIIDRLKGRKVIGRTASGGKIYQPTRAKKSNVTYGGQTQDQIKQANIQKEVDKKRKKKVETGQYDDPWLRNSPAAERRVHYQQLKGDVKEAKTQDHEHSMARSELATIEKAVKRLKNKVKGEGNIEAWVQSKITKAADYIDAAADYLDSGEHNVHDSMDEACWKGYKQEGLKKKRRKMVPNCVPVNETSFEIKHTTSDVKKAKRAKKIDALAQRGTGGEQTTAARMAGVSLPSIRKEDISLVDKILLEMEAEVITEENKPTNPKLWAKWKSKAKAKFDVYPSAYANGWAAKGYKSEGGGWKSVKEETIEDLNGNTFAEVIDLIVNEESDEEKYCKKCKKMEKRSECKYGPKTWDKMTDNSDEMEESVRIPSRNGNIIMANLTWKGKYYSIKFFFPYMKVPSRQEIQAEIDKVYPGSKVYSYQISDYQPGQPLIYVSEDWQSVNRKDKTDGLSQKAVNAYRRENPGSKLQTAVTEKNPEGKRADRRKSFCRRMKGMKSKLTSSETARDPDSRINKALKRWRCN